MANTEQLISPTEGPVTDSGRIESIDVLRGFALLGILVMNIQGFSMIGAAYLNPAAYGDLGGANWWVWVLSHLFADQKFMTLFSVLFGAGIVMMWERAEATGRKSMGLHYRRTLWLWVGGLYRHHPVLLPGAGLPGVRNLVHGAFVQVPAGSYLHCHPQR